MSNFWIEVYKEAEKNETDRLGSLVLRAARSAVPYLMRLHEWDPAQILLERVIQRDKSPASVAGVIPLLTRIAELTAGSAVGLTSSAVLARALSTAGRYGEAAIRMREVEQQATESGEFQIAYGVAGDLTNLLRVTGHYEEALVAIERTKDLMRRASSDSSVQLSAEVRRLQVMTEIGRNEEVLDALQTLRTEFRNWREVADADDLIGRWTLWEVLLETGRAAAMRTGRWEEALSLNAEVLDMKRARGVTRLELALARYNDHRPLLELKRYDEARELLYGCLAVYETDANTLQLGRVHSGIANLEQMLGHFPEAERHELAALRCSYSALSPSDCAINHFNLANYRGGSGTNADTIAAHLLASALIFFQTNNGYLAASARRLKEASMNAGPISFEELCVLVERVEGVRFRELFASLPPRAASGDEALQAVLELVSAEAAPPEISEPLRELLAAAAAGEDVEPMLAEIEQQFAGNPGGPEVLAQIRALVAKAKAR